tara:strand:+ start:581 stop:709 length:129 start_codon:yes stop_codon:yes gene_type:complete
MREALKKWCDDHYKHYGFYPYYFEYEDKLYEIILPNFNLKEI